nr:MAG TPA: hypothetical protein [Caudoviricetes sp.]
MTEKTKNIGLTKPDETEFYDVNVTNENWDITDREIGNIKNPEIKEASARENIENGDNYFTILGKIKRFFSDLKKVAFTGKYQDLEGKPEIPAAIAVKGNAEANYRTGNVNLTPDNIGALPISGGKLTGQLQVGEKVKLYTSSEGGNIQIISPDDIGLRWELDAFKGDLRFICFNNDGTVKKICQLTKDGALIANNATQSAAGLMSPKDKEKLDNLSIVNNNTTTEAGYALDARQANPNVSGSMAAQMKSNYEPKLQIVSAASTAAELGAGATRTDTIIITIPTGYSFTGFVICDYNNNSGRTLTTIQTVTVSGSNVTVLVLLYNASSGKSNTLARVKALMVKNI